MIRDAFGASKVDGGAWAGGADYSVRFDGRGPSFLPRHGGDAAREYRVRFELESVRRGASSVLVRTADVEPQVAGTRVSYGASRRWRTGPGGLPV